MPPDQFFESGASVDRGGLVITLAQVRFSLDNEILVIHNQRRFCAVRAGLGIELQRFSVCLRFQKTTCMFEPGFVVGCDEYLVLRELIFQNCKQRQPVGDVEADEDIVQKE